MQQVIPSMKRRASDSSTSEAEVPMRLLVVEDEQIVALDLRGALEDLGYIVVGTAGSSEDALRKAEDEHPDLVLMDIRLSGDVDGIQTAAILRTRFQIPVVYLTANADDATLARALDTEPCGYLAKPYNQRSLHTTIEVAFRRHELELGMRKAHDREMARLQQQKAELAGIAEHHRQEAMIDPLTGLHNRRFLDVALKRELGLARRKHRCVGIILMDLDRFKALNDQFGHAAGDSALRAVADFLHSRLRASDTACRYGGEEILIIVPGAQAADAVALAEQLRVGVEQLGIAHAGKPLVGITASFGVAAYPRDGEDAKTLILAADAALYRAKADGRNRVAGTMER
jgi:two-component system chemotaxis family response regulator WspR